MAREHRAGHRPLHPGRLLNSYPIAAIKDGPWPGRLALGPAPLGSDDPSAIAAWGADKVLGLTKPEESAGLGVPDLAGHLASAGLAWRNAPIEDFAAPDDRFNEAWPALRDCLIGRLNGGEKVLVHCRAGRGRSGTIVAALLIAGGLAPDDAIGAVRSARPGAIETTDQEAWLRQISLRG
ncbi:ADP-ribosylation/Crystallin J1 [alpha proteobacterium BAL199]|jgi:rhodanese-related sulfurtransferase|nr:ADP-ribosylation/Crystallin J1 [alpha proteobacterium BAL199]